MSERGNPRRSPGNLLWHAYNFCTSPDLFRPLLSEVYIFHKFGPPPFTPQSTSLSVNGSRADTLLDDGLGPR